MRVNLLELLDVKVDVNESYQYCHDNIGFFCKNCGTELVAEFGSFDRVNGQGLIKWFLNEEHDCPICGATLEKKGGYFLAPIVGCCLAGASKEFVEGLYGVECILDDFYNQKRSLHRVYKPIDTMHLNQVDEKFIRMAKIRDAKEKHTIQSKLETFVSSCDIPASFKKQNDTIAQVKSDTEKLKEYILTLINLENGIYSLQQRLASLYHQKFQNERFIVQCMHNDWGIMEEILRPWKTNYASCLKEAKKFNNREPAPVLLECPEEPVKPDLRTPGLFNKKKVLAENDALMAQYSDAMAAYNEAFAKYEKEKARLEQEAVDLLAKQHADQQAKTEEAKHEIAKQKAAALERFQEASKRPNAATSIKMILDKEIAEAEELMAKLYSARNELYAYNVIFAKYHDVVALSSFYEYLMSGRCSQLEGADGTYNLYESETRANLVIAQLDHIVKSLDDIKNNQYMMYAELKKINSSLSTMNNTMVKALESLQHIEVSTDNMNDHLATISKNTEVIAYNTAATAYYTKLNAELTNALGYMVAFN